MFEVTKRYMVARRGKKGQGVLRCGRDEKGIWEKDGKEIMV
jgi:hypothetical protein